MDPNKLNKYFAITIERTRVTTFDVVSDLLNLVDSLQNRIQPNRSGVKSSNEKIKEVR